MKEIDAEIATIDQQIAALQADKAALVRAKAIIQQRRFLDTSNVTKATNRPDLPSFSSQPLLSITAASEQLLRDRGSMHVNDMFTAMLDMGKKTTKQSIVSALIRNKDRFENLGRNRFRLRQESDSVRAEDARKTGEKRIRAEVIADVLREHGGRMRASEIMRILNQRGDPVTQSVLANAVMRKIDVLFTRPEPGIYQLIEHRDNTKGPHN